MEYLSTRGEPSQVLFTDCLLGGLAPDGGLYMPASWPRFDAESFAGASFAEIAAAILASFAAPWMTQNDLLAVCKDAFSGFGHPSVTPLMRIERDFWMLELHHGPTLAFKDVAMQVLGRLFEHALEERGASAVILCATSGDTGGAAVEALRGRKGVKLVVLHPSGRVSDVQRRMMTTAREPNVRNIAVRGDFDDCQRIVKSLLGEQDLRRALNLGAVNSINWARLAVQIAYYYSALVQLAAQTNETAASFSVPTGNFGDAFAGYAARAMGAKISRICVAVNQNDILHRALSAGEYAPEKVRATMSPSMDIQVASNFERLIFEALQRRAADVRALMGDFDRKKSVSLPPEALRRMREIFTSERVDEAECKDAIAAFAHDHNGLIDPHTAIGAVAARKARRAGTLAGPVICLATAHAAKFPEAVYAACAILPELPPRLAGLHAMAERYVESAAEVDRVRDIVLSFSRSSV